MWIVRRLTAVFGPRKTLARVPGNVLVPVRDTPALARGMRRMATLSEPTSLRHELLAIGAANREYVRENFIQSEVTHHTALPYRELCKSASRPLFGRRTLGGRTIAG